MANIKLGDLDDWLKRELGMVLKKATSERELKQLGEKTTKRVHDRIKKGYGVKRDGAQEERLKPLAGSYVEQRKRMSLHPSTSPSKSNLTQTGEMLGDLTYEVAIGHLTIKYKTAESKTKAKHVSKKRPHMHLSADEIEDFAEDLDNVVARLIKRMR